MTTALLLALALTGAPGPLSTHPLQRTAAKALAGEFGTLQHWQAAAYKRVLDKKLTFCGRAYLTSFGPWDPPRIFGGPYAADRGIRLTPAHCAADKGVAFGMVVWADGELRIVRDRGGAVTVRAARRRDRRNDRNLDFYTKRRDEHFKRSTPYAFVGMKR